jgi:hypothetical protein
MIQITVTSDEKDWPILEKAISDLNDPVLTIDLETVPGVAIIRSTGFLHLELIVGKLWDAVQYHSYKIILHVSSPEVIFQQPMVLIDIESPKRFKSEIESELSSRYPDKLVIEQEGKIWRFIGRFSTCMSRGIAKRCYGIGGNRIKIVETYDGMSDVSESLLRKQLLMGAKL